MSMFVSAVIALSRRRGMLPQTLEKAMNPQTPPRDFLGGTISKKGALWHATKLGRLPVSYQS
jgi:hypothetical protein